MSAAPGFEVRAAQPPLQPAASRATVIIPARDAERSLPATLAALLASDPLEPPAEIVVVDDGSSDRTAAIAERFGARVIRLKGRGPAAARNAGLRAARSDLLVFLDADCRPEPGCLAALLAPFADPAVVGVRGHYSSDQTALVARFTQLELEEKQARLAASQRIAVVDTACAAYRRSALLEHGGFDERYPATSAEDVELSFRLAEAGALLVYAPLARVRHQHAERLSRYLERKLRFGFFRARLYGRYPARLREDGYTPRLMPLQIGLAQLTLLLALVGTRLPRARRWAALGAGAQLLTSVPLIRRALPADVRLAALVPALLFARSLAQGLGLAAGLPWLIGGWLGRGRQRRPAAERLEAGR
jgi:GT2 family glycosyltransferase